MKIESIIQDQILDDNIIATSLPFLQGDGEMAELTRKYDWASTILGDPESWCSTLKSFVSTVLLSKSPMFLWWGNDLIQFYNDSYRTSLGKEGEGKHPLALGQCGKDCWPEIWPTIKPLIDHVIQKKEGVWNEDLLVPIFRNGGIEDVYWSFGYTPVLEEDGNVGGVLVTCQETTQKVNMLRKLKESDDRFKNLIRDSTVGIIVLEGESFVVKVVNDIYCTLIQKNYEDVIGQSIFDILPEANKNYKPMLSEVMKTGIPVHLNEHPFVFIEKTGNRNVYLDLDYQPYKEQDGKITGVMAFVHDVTEKIVNRQNIKESEKTIKIAEERALLAIQAANIGTFDINVETGKIVTSERMNEIFGEEKFETISDVFNLIHPHDTNIRNHAIEESNLTSKLSFECRIFTKYYELRWIRVDAKVFFDLNNKPVRRIGTVMDITENQNLLKQKDDFIGIASHELKTPITTLKASLQVMNIMKDDSPSETTHELIEYCNNSINRISILIDELLNVTKINQGQFLVQKKEFYLINEINKIINFVFKDVKHKLILSGDKEMKVIADADRISQVIINIINNALKYASNSKEVKIIIEHQDSFAKVSIIDQGLGIPKEKLPYIFNRYFKVETTIESSGLGLGLFICSEIIKHHGGQIGVESHLGTGSNFWFTLPLL